MKDVLKIAIVVPAHNEAENVSLLLKELQRNTKRVGAGDNGTNFTVFIIDDASTDDTAQIVKRFDGSDEVVLLARKKSSGIGGAYIFALKRILKKDFDYVLQMDADLQHDPKYIKKFVQEARLGKDAVVSSRYIKGGKTPDWSLYRRCLSKYGNLFARLLLGSAFTDWTGGYNLYSVAVLRKIDLSKLSNDFCFQIALKNAVLRVTKNVAEIPIIFHERKYGSSKMSGRVTLKTFVLVFRLWFGKFSGR